MLQLSSRAAAMLVVRLLRKQTSLIAKAAQKHEKAMYRVFMKAVRDAQAAVPMTELVDVLSLGHSGTGAPLFVLQPVFDALLEQTTLTTPHTPYVRAAASASETTAGVLKRTLASGARASRPKLAMRFDVTNPEVIAWAESEAAALVTSVTEQSRDAIRALIVEGFDAGVPPAETAQLIRASIGLTERDASAVMKRQISLMLRGVSASDAAANAERYAEKLTRSRALTIARTETMSAANEGQQQYWQQAIDQGVLDRDAQKVWITADPCDICEPMEGVTVGITEDFELEGPPAHPNCRCTTGIV